jgi:hypothetical protein
LVRTTSIAVGLLLLAAGGLPAQEVRVASEIDDPSIVMLEAILARRDFRVLDRDTVVGADAVVPSDAVIIGARVALEGVIAGDVAVIGGELFLRSGSVVQGAIATLGGDAFVSRLATAGPVLELPLGTDVEAVADENGYVVVVRAPPPQPTLRLPGLLGLSQPTFDRVNGFSIPWSASTSFGRDPEDVALTGSVAYRTSRRRVDVGAEAQLRLSDRMAAVGSVGSGPRSMDTWVRGNIENSLAAFFARSDVRDYFHSEGASFGIRGIPPTSLVPGEGFLAPRLTARISRDRSLDTGDPWTPFRSSRSWRPNPDIDDGVLASLVLGGVGSWRGADSRITGGASVELAPGGLGDFRFAQAIATGQWAMAALWNHDLRIRGRVMLPLGTAAAPRQRWGSLGGPGTLPAHPTGLFRGDHLAFINTIYLAPLPRLDLPLVGNPSLRIDHAMGAAWQSGETRPPWQQSLGVGAQFLFGHATLHIDPARRPLRPAFVVGIELPTDLGLPGF